MHADIFKGNFDNLEANFEGLMKNCHRSSNPLYFQVNLLSARSRLFVNMKEKDKLKDNIDTISGKIVIDTSLFGGCLDGWLSFDKCRYYKEEIRRIEESDEKANEKLAYFTNRAEFDLTAAIQSFKDEDSPKARHCTGIAMLEMVSIKSKYFGKTPTQNLHPEKDDLIQCKNLLHDVEFLGVSLRKDVEMNVQYQKSKCIYAIEMEEFVLARDCLDILSKLVKKHKRGGMLTEVETLRDRLQVQICARKGRE
ncbi:hypothetical protein FSP39_003044 [Pinctada imbricata]|uniref:Uncharacterized protein n=1 Tax=Pinctada imbricata TaxID=66713 RepID=A0AA88YHI6_PINIB|nr:hypothetical protein FSP39_003044 [Pinctada imbricata]